MKFFQKVAGCLVCVLASSLGCKKGSKNSKPYFVFKKNKVGPEWSRITPRSFSDPQMYHSSSSVLLYVFSDFSHFQILTRGRMLRTSQRHFAAQIQVCRTQRQRPTGLLCEIHLWSVLRKSVPAHAKKDARIACQCARRDWERMYSCRPRWT